MRKVFLSSEIFRYCAEQKRIVAKVEQLMTLCDSLQTHLHQRQQTAQALAQCLTQLTS